MLTKVEFKKEITNKLQEKMPEVAIKEVVVTKTNDTILDGITLTKESSPSAGLTVYFDSLYRAYIAGSSVDSIAEEITDAVSSQPVPDSIKRFPSTVEESSSRFTFKVVESKRNKRYLSDKPHRNVGAGLALVYEKVFDHDYRAAITNDMLLNMDIVRATAMKTAPVDDPALLIPMTIAVSFLVREESSYNLLDEQAINPDFLALTTESKIHGAAALFYPGMMKKICELLSCGYYILPSSIHEVIIVPDKLHPDEESLQKMVVSINRTEVQPEEILSDRVFHYDVENGLRAI